MEEEDGSEQGRGGGQWRKGMRGAMHGEGEETERSRIITYTRHGKH